MKPNIHPQWFENTVVTCSCGNVFTTGSTVETLRVAICSNCHPVFTGKEKLIDTEGLVQKFQRRQKSSQDLQKKVVSKKIEKVTQAKEMAERPRTLKEMLDFAKKNREL